MVQTHPAPSPRHAERRLEILRRAAAVFREKGYHGAGMREIARGLGLRPGALYHYFPSKDALLFACQDLSLQRLLEGAQAIRVSARPASTRLRDVARLHLDQTLDVTGGSAAHLEFHALPPGPRAAVLARRDAYEDVVRGIVEDGVAEGTFRVADPKLAALAFLGALNWCVVWWRPEGDWRAKDLADRITDLHLRGLDGDVPDPEPDRRTP